MPFEIAAESVQRLVSLFIFIATLIIDTFHCDEIPTQLKLLHRPLIQIR